MLCLTSAWTEAIWVLDRDIWRRCFALLRHLFYRPNDGSIRQRELSAEASVMKRLGGCSCGWQLQRKRVSGPWVEIVCQPLFPRWKRGWFFYLTKSRRIKQPAGTESPLVEWNCSSVELVEHQTQCWLPTDRDSVFTSVDLNGYSSPDLCCPDKH